MSRKHQRSLSWSNGPMPDEIASLKVKMLTESNNIDIDECSDISNLDDFPDNISDVSEAVSYQSVPISNEEKLRRELLFAGTTISEPKFASYNYEQYNSGFQRSNTFDVEMNRKLSGDPFPTLKKGCRVGLLTIFLIIIATLLIVIPTVMYGKSSSRSNLATLNNPHTAVYDTYWNSEGNSNNLFYSNNTFGYSVFRDPCVHVTDLNILKTIINSQVGCIGNWCLNGQFGCGDTSDCYDLNYIIPETQLLNTCGNITGNLVFSWKKWNTELQGLKSSDYTKEISIVYGIETFSYVRDIISNCGLSNRC